MDIDYEASKHSKKRRKLGEKEHYEVSVRIADLRFSEVQFPACLKVGWLKDGVAIETRTKNTLNGQTKFKKKLKRMVSSIGGEISTEIIISQKVGVGSVPVGYASIDISDCVKLEREFEFTSPLDGVKGRSGAITIVVLAKQKHPNVIDEFTTLGSASSSQQINLTFIAPIQTTHLLSFEDVYMLLLQDYEHIFSLDFVLEHGDHVDVITMNESNTDDLDNTELESVRQLFLSLNLFQEKEDRTRYHFPFAAFDLAAFKRVIIACQECRSRSNRMQAN